MTAADEAKGRHPELTPICAIGASAGGVNALSRLFRRLDPELGLSYVVIIHLTPDTPSQLAAILGNCTQMAVSEVTKPTNIKPNCVYVISPNHQLQIDGNKISATKFDEPRGKRAPIDQFFRSLAAGRGDGIAVILTGAGSDGANGVKAVKEGGGVIFAQDPGEAEYPMMPRSTISTGLADFVESLDTMPGRIAEVVQSKMALRSLKPEGAEAELRQILVFLRSRTGHDFSNYKRATVLRRVGRRMQVTRKESISAYASYLRENPEEASNLFRDLLISVTTFFRDPAAHEVLARRVIAPAFEQLGEEEDLRVWVAGCATGEEAYTIAMLFMEEAARRDVKPRLQIFATDLDEGALATAREGRYPASIEADLSEARLQRFFVHEGPHYRIRKEVRDLVLFATHSVLKDPPFMRLNLISCRNLMIYLERDVQRQLLTTFHYGLQSGGHLFLGSAETADIAAELFQTVDREARLYCSRPQAARTLPMIPQLRAPVMSSPFERQPRAEDREKQIAVAHAMALETLAPPSILVDEGHKILHLSDNAGRFLQPSKGVLNSEVSSLLKPELRLDLKSTLQRAFEANETALTLPIATQFETHHRRILMQVTPLPDNDRMARRALIFFLDGGEIGTDYASPQGEPEVAEAAATVRRLSEELRQAHERLSASRKEYEIATQELRAANEELQSMNEEYRSTSEELETSKEELQSMNEELHTVNAELKTKLASISSAHNDLQNLIAATEIGTLFLDSEMHIKLFTPMVQRIFNITESDIGRAITDFTHRLDYEGLAADAATVRRDLTPLEKEVLSRDGRRLLVRFRPYRTLEDRIDGVVVTFVDITARHAAEEKLSESEERLRRLVESTSVAVWETDADGNMAGASPGWQAFTGLAARASLGAGWFSAIHPEDRRAAQRSWEKGIARGKPFNVDFRLREAPDRWRWVKASAAPLGANGGADRIRWIGMCIDIDALKRLQDQQAVLVAELQHRTRNLIGLIKSMADQTLATSGSMQQFKAMFDQRLQALSRVQGILSRADQEMISIGELVRLELDAMGAGADKERVQLEGPEVFLPKSVVQTFALALHELATNATKYGALANDHGRLVVTWRETAEEEAGRRLLLDWTEQGLDLARELKGPMTKGFGRQLIEEALPYSHNAETSFILRKSGVRCTIDLPLDQ